MVTKLLEHSANPNQGDHELISPLMQASSEGHDEIIKLLLDYINQVDKEGYSPLMYAVQGEQLAVVDLLIMHGANIDQRSTDGYSAIDLAREQGATQITESLLKASKKQPSDQGVQIPPHTAGFFTQPKPEDAELDAEEKKTSGPSKGA
jgi:ankyrin repeat protein